MLGTECLLEGKNKLADKWNKHSYIVIEVLNEVVPVNFVQRKSGDLMVKTLHRNMLLPFTVIRSSLDLDLFHGSSIVKLANLQPLYKTVKTCART